MTFECRTAQHLAQMALYYADKASANYAIALRERGFTYLCQKATLAHHAELGAEYSQLSRFYRDRLTEWLAGAAERAERYAAHEAMRYAAREAAGYAIAA